MVPLNKVQLDLIFTNLTSNPQIATYDSMKDDSFLKTQSRSFMNSSILSSRQMSIMDSKMGHNGEPQSNCRGKMDFEHFLKFLETISKKILPSISVSKAFKYLIADFILPLLQ